MKNSLRPIHPGEILREDVLEPMGLTASSLARFLSTSAQIWMDLQATYDLKLVEQEAGKRIARAIKPARRAA